MGEKNQIVSLLWHDAQPFRYDGYVTCPTVAQDRGRREGNAFIEL